MATKDLPNSIPATSQSPESPLTWDQAFALEPKPAAAKGQSPPPAVGLALSGGGIRSATFNLGVLEHLHDSGILQRLHYLSTVSGGGYIGAWLSANTKRNPAWLDPGTSWEKSIQHLRRFSNYLSPRLGFLSADTWTMAMVWFRNALLIQITVFLAIALALCLPRLFEFGFKAWPSAGIARVIVFLLTLLALCGVAGNLRSLRHSGSWILQAHRWPYGMAGAALCWALAWLAWPSASLTDSPSPLLPSLLSAALIVAGGFLLIPAAVRLAGRDRLNYGQAWTQFTVVLPLCIAASMIGAAMHNFASQAPFQSAGYAGLLTQAFRPWLIPLAFVLACFGMLAFCSVDLRSWKGYVAAVLVAPLSTAGLYALLCAVQLLLGQLSGLEGDRFHAFILAPALIVFCFSLSAVLLMGLLGRRALEEHREWWSRLAAWLFIYGAAWLFIALAAFFGPWLAGKLGDLQFQWTAIAGWIATTAGGLFAGNSESTNGNKSSSISKSALEFLAHLAPLVFIAGIFLLLSTLLHLVLYNLADSTAGPALASGAYWLNLNSLTFGSTLTVSLAVAALLLLFAWRVDINEFSLNAFYRSRLARCYLGATRDNRRPQNFTGFDPDDDLPLADLAPGNPAKPFNGPFHIVNAALNLGGASDLELHTRQCASFTFTPLHCGSRRDGRGERADKVGYFPTAAYLRRGGGLTLGQAISVSGAAASPNMGTHTSPVVAFLLTVFNVRLGWWFPRPAGGASDSTSPSFSFYYLIKELFGSAGQDSDFLMISDGGHFENLATYELVRRKCPIIIVGDAEADPGLTFCGLGSLIRMCEVDFGATISIDVQSIRPDPTTGLSQSHCAVGSIAYSDGTTGTLIYLKSSLTGGEDTAIRQYKSSHPDFPHESTADQFFSEDQFESYRQLGYHVAESAFKHVRIPGGVISRDAITSLKAVWTPQLASNAAFTSLAERLSNIWDRLSCNKDLGFLDHELFPSVDQPPLTASPEARRNAFYLCCELVQLMEDVHLALNLQDTYDHPDQQGWMELFRQWARSHTLNETYNLTRHTYGQRFQHFYELRLRDQAGKAAGTA